MTVEEEIQQLIDSYKHGTGPRLSLKSLENDPEFIKQKEAIYKKYGLKLKR